MAGRLATLIATSILLCTMAAHAQNAVQIIPERSRMVVEALVQSGWQSIEPGLDLMDLQAGSVSVTALRIDPSNYDFSLSIQSGPDGERVDEFGKREEADVAINGGFFGEKEPGKGLFPVGYLKIGDVSYSKPWSRSGGFLVLRDGKPEISPTIAGIPGNTNAVLQSKPLLIEPGGNWAMNTNLGNMRRRSLVCLQTDGNVVIAVISGLGMSLFEAGWLMRERSVGGYFECDAALALDGGGSTQIWMRDETLPALRGDNAVHNALLISRR